jgi:hypothetical protein
LLRSIVIGISRAISSTTFVVMALLYFTQPHYLRAFTPQLFGINKVAENIYTDQRLKTNAIKQAIATAEKNSAKFFENQTAAPTYIVCFNPNCANVFGALPLGLTLGYHRIIISPDGFSQQVFNHERIHADLHALVGITGVYTTPFPMWFNEGLAEYVSGFGCQGGIPNTNDIMRVKTAETIWQWRRLVSDKQYRRHYGAACRAVEQISQRIGKKRLSEIVHTARNQAQFLADIGS